MNHEEIAKYGTAQSPVSAGFPSQPAGEPRRPRTELASQVLENQEKTHRAKLQERKNRKETV